MTTGTDLVERLVLTLMSVKRKLLVAMGNVPILLARTRKSLSLGDLCTLLILLIEPWWTLRSGEDLRFKNRGFLKCYGCISIFMPLSEFSYPIYMVPLQL